MLIYPFVTNGKSIFHTPLEAGLTETTISDQVTGEVTAQVAGEVTGEVMGEVRRLLQILDSRYLTRSQAQSALALKGQANFRDRYLGPALAAGLIEMTIPDKPRSSRQKYRLTAKGKKLLDEKKEL